jgi:hypothetical protein
VQRRSHGLTLRRSPASPGGGVGVPSARRPSADTARAVAAKGGNAMKTRLACGEKHGRKRMATLGAVYDARARAALWS